LDINQLVVQSSSQVNDGERKPLSSRHRFDHEVLQPEQVSLVDTRLGQIDLGDFNVARRAIDVLSDNDIDLDRHQPIAQLLRLREKSWGRQWSTLES
jgi:hypothetical protein